MREGKRDRVWGRDEYREREKRKRERERKKRKKSEREKTTKGETRK